MNGLATLQGVIDEYRINLVNAIFIFFTITMLFFGALISFVEDRLPVSISQSLRYGKHQHKGPSDPIISRLEVPKSWFKHFYIFAFIWTLIALVLVMRAFILNKQASELILQFLDLIAGGRHRPVQVNSTCSLVAIVLMTMQTGRRFYETNFLQIFSKSAKINISHYMVGYIHYFGTILAILANTEGFVRGTQPTPFSFSKINVLQYVCICLFHFSWQQQYNSNMILVKLRQDPKTQKVVSEQHLLPRGGFFYVVSSPHMLFEVLLYVALLGIIPASITWRWIVFWVISNQVHNAWLTHKWYKENFKEYPKVRRAIIPFIF